MHRDRDRGTWFLFDDGVSMAECSGPAPVVCSCYRKCPPLLLQPADHRTARGCCSAPPSYHQHYTSSQCPSHTFRFSFRAANKTSTFFSQSRRRPLSTSMKPVSSVCVCVSGSGLQHWVCQLGYGSFPMLPPGRCCWSSLIDINHPSSSSFLQSLPFFRAEIESFTFCHLTLVPFFIFK